MGKIATRDDALKILRRDNPTAKAQDVQLYADAWLDYQAAQANIDAHGAIVFHPKTGSPIDNPYLRIRAAASTQMQKIPRLKTDGLWPSAAAGRPKR